MNNYKTPRRRNHKAIPNAPVSCTTSSGLESAPTPRTQAALKYRRRKPRMYLHSISQTICLACVETDGRMRPVEHQSSCPSNRDSLHEKAADSLLGARSTQVLLPRALEGRWDKRENDAREQTGHGHSARCTIVWTRTLRGVVADRWTDKMRGDDCGHGGRRSAAIREE